MLHEKTQPPQVHPLCETVQPHFALSITRPEMMLVLERLKNAGVALIEELTESPTGCLQAFFYDFDMNMIEINNEDERNYG